jgi:hypothetical protein
LVVKQVAVDVLAVAEQSFGFSDAKNVGEAVVRPSGERVASHAGIASFMWASMQMWHPETGRPDASHVDISARRSRRVSPSRRQW